MEFAVMFFGEHGEPLLRVEGRSVDETMHLLNRVMREGSMLTMLEGMYNASYEGTDTAGVDND